MEGIIHRLLDGEFMRIECALEKNFEYLDKLDRMREEATMRELERLRNPTAISTTSKKKAAPQNTSVYIMGLTTYIACKQLENVCSRLGRVKRIKFYKDDRGGLKGDALVTFATNAAMEAAVAKLNNFEIKPGVRITAKVAEFSKKQEEPAAAAPPLQEAPAEGIDAVTAFLNDIQNLHPQVHAAASEPAPPVPPPVAPPVQETTTSEAIPEAETDTAVLETPSRSILLYNIIDCEPTTAEDCLDLEEDLQMECSNYGKVLRVQILLERKVVIVEYESLPSAIKCLEVMNGRWFGGTQIRATFDPSAPEEPEDEDTKLLAFLASV
ncbi:hypothetical protein THRCLA_21810 [Thraustotheca clavata]|uniref:RRM domain-containing protein n=1 Tax=Thraustotheca clavata TaxID=74557 RepID=A0A1V9ZNN9_9STRA|nr:hypothetical protein THRCLA_21810 [Thraustotheca clavata]